MTVHLVNPSHVSFGIGVITPRWMYVLASAIDERYGLPALTDETLDQIDPATIKAGDLVGIGIHSGNALRGYEVGRMARERGAFVVFGGIHCSLYPDEPAEHGGAHAVVSGDGDCVWPVVLEDWAKGDLKPRYEAGRVEPDQFLPGRWDLLPPGRYMWASVQTVRGCPKHCSFCSVWRTDGQVTRQRSPESVVSEIVDLRRRGFRFIALADDNFYPVTTADIAAAALRADPTRLHMLEALRAERFAMLERLAKLPGDTIFFTQITLESANDPEFLEAMRKAHIIGALVGVESVSAEGLKDIYKPFNPAGQDLVDRLRTFRRHGIHVLGSFIFGLPSDKPDSFDATAKLAEEAELTFAQFVPLTPFPGTIDFDTWAKKVDADGKQINGIPMSRYWLIPQHLRPRVYVAHPTMSVEQVREGTQGVWDAFYSLKQIWRRSQRVNFETLKSRLAFVLVSKLYRQMYANTGIAADSGRVNRAAQWARLIAKPTRRLFAGPPMPDLQVPS